MFGEKIQALTIQSTCRFFVASSGHYEQLQEILQLQGQMQSLKDSEAREFSFISWDE